MVPRETSEADVAWAAGLYEGEGSVVLNGNAPRFQLKGADEDVIQRLLGVLGGSVYGPYEYTYADGITRKPMWAWTSDTTDARSVARLLYPHLGRRRRAAIDALGLLDQLAMEV